MSVKERWHKFRPLPENIRDRLRNLQGLFQQEGVLLAYLFGSLAHGDTGQDVDLAILPAKRNLASLRQKLWQLLGTQRLDLVNLKTASPVLRFEIIKNGLLIYKKDENVENDFELATLKQYKDTAYLRKKQVEVLKRRTDDGHKT